MMVKIDRDEKQTNLNIRGLSAALRNQFKSACAREGKDMKTKMIELMEQPTERYIADDGSEFIIQSFSKKQRWLCVVIDKDHIKPFSFKTYDEARQWTSKKIKNLNFKNS